MLLQKLVHLVGPSHKINDAGQLLLHVLLIRGLPGAHMLIKEHKAAVKVQCPVTRLYPFQLAALKWDDVTIAAPNNNGSNNEDQPDEIRTLHDQLDREQLSRIFSLLRQFPDPVKHACDMNNTFDNLKAVHRKKARLELLKRKKRLFEERIQKLEEEVKNLEYELGGKDDDGGNHMGDDDSDHHTNIEKRSGAKRSRLE